MRILLTGFGPFGEVVNNPSARVVDHFQREGMNGHDLTALVLPVSYERVERALSDALLTSPFDAAILLGVATGSGHIRLERYAHNRRASREDEDGFAPAEGAILPGAPERYTATLEVQPLLEALQRSGLPVRISDDAGGYLCNYAYFLALHTLARLGSQTRCLFVHLPAAPDTTAIPQEMPTLPLPTQIEMVRRILTCL